MRSSISISQKRDQAIGNKQILDAVRYAVQQLQNGPAAVDKASYTPISKYFYSVLIYTECLFIHQPRLVIVYIIMYQFLSWI